MVAPSAVENAPTASPNDVILCCSHDLCITSMDGYRLRRFGRSRQTAITSIPMREWRLYRSRDLPGQWIGSDLAGALMVWPAERRGWAKRVSYTGPKRALEEVEPALARGTGWAGGGRAHHPRSATGR